MSDFEAIESTVAGKHLDGDTWSPPALRPALPLESEESERAVEWAASGMPTVGSGR